MGTGTRAEKSGFRQMRIRIDTPPADVRVRRLQLEARGTSGNRKEKAEGDRESGRRGSCTVEPSIQEENEQGKGASLSRVGFDA